jgi:hypothetical protein
VSSSPSGIDCPGTCKSSYATNTKVVLTPKPAAGSFFVGWTGSCAGTGPCSVTMAGDRDATASFDKAPTIGDASSPQLPPQFPPPVSSVSVNVSGDGSVIQESRGLSVVGRTTAGAAIKCGLAGYQCYASLQPGSTLSLIAKAGPGYAFARWTGACQVVQGPRCKVSLSAARTVSAAFRPKVASRTFAAQLAPTPRFNVKWKASVGRGTLKVTGMVAKPAIAKLQLRRPHGGPLLTESVTVDKGKFVFAPKLIPGLLAGGAHLFPGGFMVSLTGTSGKLKMPLQIQAITLPAPPEGVVRKSFPSAAKGGKQVKAVAAKQGQVYANFVFQNQPVRNAPLTVRWYWPNGKLLGSIKKSNRPTVFSFIREPPGNTLPKGNWVAELRAGNKIVQRLLVRVR